MFQVHLGVRVLPDLPAAGFAAPARAGHGWPAGGHRYPQGPASCGPQAVALIPSPSKDWSRQFARLGVDTAQEAGLHSESKVPLGTESFACPVQGSCLENRHAAPQQGVEPIACSSFAHY